MPPTAKAPSGNKESRDLLKRSEVVPNQHVDEGLNFRFGVCGLDVVFRHQLAGDGRHILAVLQSFQQQGAGLVEVEHFLDGLGLAVLGDGDELVGYLLNGEIIFQCHGRGWLDTSGIRLSWPRSCCRCSLFDVPECTRYHLHT